jgi:uncharacterized membrane protein YeaQ/YmgE (transglycosylase-associated protein family)
MSIIAWLVVGLLAGWIGSMIVNRNGEGINLYSIGVAVIGSVVVLLIYHAVVRRRTL